MTNKQDFSADLDDLNTSIAEIRPLLTNFSLLRETIWQQLKATRIAILALAILLSVVIAFLAKPSFSVLFASPPKEMIFAVVIVIFYGLASFLVINFNLVAYIRNTTHAQISLENELVDILNAHHNLKEADRSSHAS